MRYLKVHLNSTTEEQQKRGIFDGTVEKLSWLLTMCPELKSFDNQTKYYRLMMKFDEFKKDAKEGDYFEMDEKDHSWMLSLLKKGQFSRRTQDGKEIPMVLGKELVDIEDMPNVDPREKKKGASVKEVK